MVGRREVEDREVAGRRRGLASGRLCGCSVKCRASDWINRNVISALCGNRHTWTYRANSYRGTPNHLLINSPKDMMAR